MFHSMAYHLGTTAGALRAAVVDAIRRQPDRLINGTPLKDWIAWETGGGTPAAYAARMSGRAEWGGAMELTLLAHLFGRPIRVYRPMRTPSGASVYVQVADIVLGDPPAAAAASASAGAGVAGPLVRLVWTGGHYMPLVAVPAAASPPPAGPRHR